MKFLTMAEYDSMKVYALDNVIYARIERKFVNAMGNEMLGRKLLANFMEMTIRELSANSWVNILDCFMIMG